MQLHAQRLKLRAGELRFEGERALLALAFARRELHPVARAHETDVNEHRDRQPPDEIAEEEQRQRRWWRGGRARKVERSGTA
jgi:hypothetical protein